MSENVMLALFVANIVLIIMDASIGYHVAPDLMRLAPGDGAEPVDASVRSMRRMLAGVVTLYMFFNCLAYFRHETSLMLIVTALILFDLGGQVYMRYRSARKTGGDGGE